MQALVLWLLTSAALTAGSPRPPHVAEPVARPASFQNGPEISASSGAAAPAQNINPSRPEVVYEADGSDGVPTPAEEPDDSSESSAEDDDDDEDWLPENEDVDARSIFAALFDDDEDQEDGDHIHREARFASAGDLDSSSASITSDSSAPSEVRSVSDPSTISKYNHFIDVFFRRVNSELSANGDPMEISLSKKNRKTRKGEKGLKKKKGKGKKGNKSKKDKRNPRSFSQENFNGTDGRVLEDESAESVENSEDDQGFIDTLTDVADDDSEELLDDETEVSEGSSRQSKDLEFNDEEEADPDAAEKREGRGLGMERRRAESKRLKQNRGNSAKNGKQRKNRNKKGKKGKRRRRKGGKNRPGGQRRRKKNKGNRGRSRDSMEEMDAHLSQYSELSDSGMGARKRKDETQNRGGDGDNSGKDRKRKKNKKNKKNNKNKRGSKNKAETMASVSGFSSLIRQGDVNVTQSSNTQRISSHFALGPVSVLLTRRFSDGTAKTAVSTALLRGVAVIEVNKSGRARVTRLKITKPSSVVTEGSLRSDDGTKKKGKKSEKVVKTSIRRVSPQISKQIETTARSVLDTTSRAVRS